MGHARARKIPAQLVEDEEYQLRHERVAGIDIAKAKADVCTRLPPQRDGGRRASRVEEVPAAAKAILALAVRLIANGVELVVMESTSDYWRIWYYLLETAGLNVQLVNPSHARQLARPKTDRLDAQWIARLAEMGLLRPSFVPPPEIRALRDLTRTRLQLVCDRSREWQRLEKLLEGMLVKLSSAVHSLAKVQSARAILEAIADGERDPKALAALAHPNVKGGRAAVEEALQGMTLAGCRAHADPRPPGPHHAPGPVRRGGRGRDRGRPGRDPGRLGDRRRRRDQPGAGRGPDPAALPAAERLAEIPGVSLALARAIIAETGLDMTRFQTADHLVSWPASPPSPASPGPGAASRRKGKATPTCAATAPRPPTAPPAPAPSSARGSAACPGASTGTGQDAPSPAPSSSSSGTSSPTPKPGTPTSDPAGTSARPTPTAAPAAS